MMNLMRKICAVLLAAAMIVSMAIPCLAEDDDWWNILLLGGDSRSLEEYGRTDAMIILSINTKTSEIKMTSIMRDTWVEMPGRASKNKINAANVFGGPELAMATVNQCFGTEIEDYVLVNMAGLIDIIDALGGVELEITESEMGYINEYATSYMYDISDSDEPFYDGATSLDEYGLVHLNGLLAMSFARNRYTDSDYGRVMRQQKILLALAENLKSMDFTEMMKLAEILPENVQMNLDPSEIISLIPVALSADFDAIRQYRIPADGTYESGMYDGTWAIRPDFEANQKLLHEFIYPDAEGIDEDDDLPEDGEPVPEETDAEELTEEELIAD